MQYIKCIHEPHLALARLKFFINLSVDSNNAMYIMAFAKLHRYGMPTLRFLAHNTIYFHFETFGIPHALCADNGQR